MTVKELIWKMLNKSVVLIFICIIVSWDVSAYNTKKITASGAVDSVLQTGEELTYNVSFLGIDLGQVKVKNLETITKDNRTTYKTIAYIDSYKGVPLVDLHAVYESIFDPAIYSTWFHARDKKDTQWISYIYNFDYSRQSVYVEEGRWKSGKIDRRDTLRIDTLTQDGLSLFFYARKHAADRNPVNIPVIVNEKKGNAYINFTGERTKEKIDAVDYPVDVIYFDGQANFIGVFGLTGGFEGWFSNDNAHIPILAKMKVLIGSIHIELVSWKREGWSPPRYSN